MNEDNNKQKTIFGIPCEGCTKRAEALSAVNWWGIDTAILLSMAILVGAIIFVQYEKRGQ